MTLLAKVSVVLVVPVAVWGVSLVYQSREHARASAQAGLERTVQETGQVLEMASDFQVALDKLTTTCSKDAHTSNNLCLAEYVERLIRLNELTNRFSWKTAALPLPPRVMDTVKTWKKVWGDTQNNTKRALATMAKENEVYDNASKLLDCQKLDFADSECGARLQPILAPFRSMTIVAMCEVFVDMQGHVLTLYESMPRIRATESLEQTSRANLDASECNKIIDDYRKIHTEKAAADSREGVR